MVDLSQFQQTYFEECAELLAEIESRLIDLSSNLASNLGDQDGLNAVFRAVHSIKGGAGAFGFEQLVRFSHVFETLMEAMRSQKVPVTRQGVDVLIRASDVLSGIVESVRVGAELPSEYGHEVAAELMELCIGSGTDHPVSSEGNDTSAAGPQGETENRFHVVFAPHADLFKNANEPLYLLRELCALGQARVEVDESGLPDLNSMDPDTAYLTWTIDLTTTASEADIREVFEFVEDDCDLTVQMLPTAELAAELAAEPATVVAETAMSETLKPSPAPAVDGLATGIAADASRTTIRVDLEKIDRLVNMVGEIVITQAMLGEQVNQLPVDMFPRIVQGVEDLSAHTRELQESVMSIRAQPVKLIFARMQRIVHDTANTLGKNVRLVLTGENTEVDKTVVEKLSDPLTHMVRNAIDHGVETPEQRRAAGKPEEAIISLSASQRGGRIIIEVSDDGAGPVSYTHLRAHETKANLVCRLLLEKKK